MDSIVSEAYTGILTPLLATSLLLHATHVTQERPLCLIP